jgi:hypothetical protein
MNRPRSWIFGGFGARGKTDCGGEARVVLQEPEALCGKPESVDFVLVKTHLSLRISSNSFLGMATAAIWKAT